MIRQLVVLSLCATVGFVVCSSLAEMAQAGQPRDAAPLVAGPAVPAGEVAPASVSPLPDPIENPTGALSVVTRLWRSGAIPAASIVALYLMAIVAARKIEWLTEGKRAGYTAAVLGMLATLAEPAIGRGTTPSMSMAIAAGATALALALSGTAKPTEKQRVDRVRRESLNPPFGEQATPTLRSGRAPEVTP